MYQNFIFNSSTLYLNQYQLLSLYYQRQLLQNALETMPYLSQGPRPMGNQFYPQPSPVHMQEEYMKAVMRNFRQENFSRVEPSQIASSPFLELNSRNKGQCMEAKTKAKEEVAKSGECNEKAVSDSTKGSDLQIDTIQIGAQEEEKTKNKQLISQKRRRDKPIILKPPKAPPLKRKGKKTQKERAHELMEDSFLNFFDKRNKPKEQEEEEEESYTEDKAIPEDEGDKINADTETDSTSTKIIFHSQNYQSTSNAKEFMKYNFNFDLNAQYKTEKLITNFENQHVILNKNDFGLINVNKTGNDISNLTHCYNTQLPKRVFAHPDYPNSLNE